MSSGYDDRLEETREQIRAIVREIALLSEQAIPPNDFFDQFLQKSVLAIGAHGGAVFLQQEGNLHAVCQQALSDLLQANPQEQQASIERCLRRCLADKAPIIVAPQTEPQVVGDAGETVSNPTDFPLFYTPILGEDAPYGVLLIIQRSGRDAKAFEGFSRFLTGVCGYAADFIKSDRLRHASEEQRTWTDLVNFATQIHSSLDPEKIAYSTANTGRDVMSCDRFSLALVRPSGRLSMRAISGQDVVERKSILVKRMVELGRAVGDEGLDQLVYLGGEPGAMVPPVRDALDQYLEASNMRSMVGVPVRNEGLLLGVIYAETVTENGFQPADVARVQLLARQTSQALRNARQYHGVPFLNLLRLLGKIRDLVFVFQPMKLAIRVGVALLVVYFLFFYMWELKIKCDAIIRPELKTPVFAPEDGIVREVLVKTSDYVEQGTLLFKVANRELEIALAETVAQIQQAEADLQLYQSEASKRAESPDARGNVLRTEKLVIGLKARQKLQERQVNELSVRAAEAGEIITPRIEEELPMRPVTRGDKLMEIAAVDSVWILKLLVPEDQIGHVRRAFVQAEEESNKVEVLFILNSHPEDKFTGTVRTIASQASLIEDQNVVEAVVDIDINLQKLMLWTDGKGKAKVMCGQRMLGYVIFRDLIEFARATLFF